MDEQKEAASLTYDEELDAVIATWNLYYRAITAPGWLWVPLVTTHGEYLEDPGVIGHLTAMARTHTGCPHMYVSHDEGAEDWVATGCRPGEQAWTRRGATEAEALIVVLEIPMEQSP